MKSLLAFLRADRKKKAVLYGQPSMFTKTRGKMFGNAVPTGSFPKTGFCGPEPPYLAA
jgi:hypothetical protein